MSEVFYTVLAVSAGILLGAFFFGGLWWTVKKGVTYSNPALLFIGSMLIRTAVVLAGFYFISFRHWERFFACIAGFIIARIIITRLTKLPTEKQMQSEKESN